MSKYSVLSTGDTLSLIRFCSKRHLPLQPNAGTGQDIFATRSVAHGLSAVGRKLCCAFLEGVGLEVMQRLNRYSNPSKYATIGWNGIRADLGSEGFLPPRTARVRRGRGPP